MSQPKLGKTQRHHLRQLAHDIKPLVIVGNKGLTESVLEEINLALEHHELIKVRVNAADKTARNSMIEKIQQHCDAAIVITIGHIVGLYKQADEPKIILPK